MANVSHVRYWHLPVAKGSSWPETALRIKPLPAKGSPLSLHHTLSWEPRPAANAVNNAEVVQWLQSLRPEAGLLRVFGG